MIVKQFTGIGVKTASRRQENSRLLVRRLAMLIAGGVNPGSVWPLLADDPNIGEIATAIVLETEAGTAAAQGLVHQGLPEIAAVWHVAETSGAPMAEALTKLAEQLDAREDAARARKVAFAGPKATMQLVTALPVIGIVFSFLLGLNALAVLFGSPLGWAITGVGIALMWAGRTWSASLMRKAAGPITFPGYVSDLMVVALAGGTSVQRAKLVVTDVLDRFRVPGTSLQELTSKHGALVRSITLAEAAGVSVSQMLAAEAAAARREFAGELDVRAAKLGVTLMMPLGVCILPAFIVLSVIPMMLSLFQHSTIS